MNQDQISFIANCAEVVSSKLKPVHGGCLYASSALAVLLSDEADMDVQVSVGSLELDGNIVFKNSSVGKLLKLSDGIPKNWNGHCWVTVEDIIIDMSIFQTIYSSNNAEMMSKFDHMFGGYKAYLLGQMHKLIELGIVYNEIERLHSDEVDILFGSGNKLGIISS